MGGDYLAMQREWMNAPPQIGHTLPPLPTSSSHSRCLLFILNSWATWMLYSCWHGAEANVWSCIQISNSVLWHCWGQFCDFLCVSSVFWINISSALLLNYHISVFRLNITSIHFLDSSDYYLLLSGHGQCHCVKIQYLTGYLVFTPERDQYSSAIVQTSFFKHNWLCFFLRTGPDTLDQTNPCCAMSWWIVLIVPMSVQNYFVTA